MGLCASGGGGVMLSEGAKLLLIDLAMDPDTFVPTKDQKKFANELEAAGLASFRASKGAARITKAGIFARQQAEGGK